jgi:hypothetical protein
LGNSEWVLGEWTNPKLPTKKLVEQGYKRKFYSSYA